MYNNFYIRFNYKNIIPFNLKKKKLRVHANIIGSKTTNLYGFFVGGEVKFWYYHFGINGLKRDSVFLVKKFLNKKLGVFFISNFNMVEGKWLFPKIYEQYYKSYLFLKKRQNRLFKNNLIIKNNYALYNINYDIKYFSYMNIYNIFKLNYIYHDICSILDINKNNNTSNLYKFEKLLKFPLLYNKNNKNKNNIFDWSNIQERFNSVKKFQWNWNFYLKSKLFKKKTPTMWVKQTPFWLIQKRKWYYEQKENPFFKKKWNFHKEQNHLNNIFIKKNIINIIQFLKMNKAISKINKKNLLLLFYMFYLHFNFIKLYQNFIKKKYKKKKNKNLVYYKYLKKKNIKKLIKKNIKKLYNIINIKLNKKKINRIKLLYYKNVNKEYNKKFYIKFFIILKKKLRKFYKFKFLNKNYIFNNINNNLTQNYYIMYYNLYKIWAKYNKKNKRKKLIKLYFLKKKSHKKYQKKYKNKNLYLLWLYYILKR